MYPGTQFNWIDQSFIQPATIVVPDPTPTFLAVHSFDQGPEEFREIEGNDFYNLYGNPDFFAHGQNSIQLANIIDSGGRLFVKRVVAPDSTLANLVILAKVKPVQKELQRTDELGNLLYWTDDTKTEITTDKTSYKVMDLIYLDADGNETTEYTDTPVYAASISYEARSFDGLEAGSTGERFKDIYKRFKELALGLLDTSGEESVYPLFIIADNGRGKSKKAIRITPDYNTSRGAGHMFYNFDVLEGTTRYETFLFTVNPEVIYADTSYRLSEDASEQTMSVVDENVFQLFVQNLSEISSVPVDDLYDADVIFGKTNKGADIGGIMVDSEGIDIQAVIGIELANGENGVFGDAPADPDNVDAYAAWTQAIKSVYAGDFDDVIYDVDEHKISAVLDANYPKAIKEAIGELVMFREDCVFLRDIGTGKYTFSEIRYALNNLPPIYDESKRKFIANYVTSYEIKDPNTQKNIEVTMLYDMASLMTDHFRTNYNAPTAGTYNGFVLESAIKGTINFTPINTPKANMKQLMEDLHANYAVFEGDNCVVQTTYTSQDTLSQLSFLNNVIAIQEVMRAVRRACPAHRYSLATGSDLTSYAKHVQNVLDQFAGRFDVLEFEYTANALQAEQKIFYASIRFAFLNWAQTEIFDLYAINNE